MSDGDQATRRIRLRSVSGDRDGLVDAAFAAVLAALALVALQPAFGGVGPYRIGMVGFVAGVGAVWLVQRRRLSPPLVVVVAAGAFLAFGVVAVPHAAPAGVVPTPGALSALVRALVHGWKDAITTAPPVGVDHGLGIVPYSIGFSAGFGGLLAARRSRSSGLPVVPALVGLALAIAFGDLSSTSVVACGGAFAVVGLSWAAVRSHRDRRDVSGQVYWPRLVKAGVMLLVLGVGGVVLSGPLGSSEERAVLRRDVEPPFDPRRYPSPLAGLRNFLADENHDRQVMSVEGLPEGASLRLATLDVYDGVVWAVGGPDAPGSGRFERVGTSITPAPSGRPGALEVEVGDLVGVWVPTVGSTESTRFLGARAEEQIAAYRFNRSTGDGVSPAGLVDGDRYRLSIRERASGRKGADRGGLGNPRADAGASRTLAPLPEVPEDLRELAVQMAQGETSDLAKAELIEETLRAGFYSNGGPDKPAYAASAPGHSIYRLRAFLDPSRPRPVGDEEQYAAAMALVARINNLPARVVVGFTVPADEHTPGSQEIRGEHADAWVEIAFEGQGWVRFDPTPPRDQTPQEQQREQPQSRNLEVQPDPKADYLQPPELRANAATKGDDASPDPSRAGGGFGLPPIVMVAVRYVGVPSLVVLAAGGGIVGAKGLRRRRRRSRGSGPDRLAGAWAEAMDVLRDHRVPSSRRPTRMEWAATVPTESWDGAASLAASIDHAMFAPSPPTGDEAVDIWAQVDRQRAVLAAPRNRRRRLLAALSLRSFWYRR